MAVYIIEGSTPLHGNIRVHGAKNAALPVLAAALLPPESEIEGCPRLSDTAAAMNILRSLGCRVEQQPDGTAQVDSRSAQGWEIPESCMREMRSSIIFLGAILTRYGRARVSFPGGCELGPRPIDLHIDALRRLGVEIEESGGCLRCCAPEGIQGTYISLSFPSVGATENIILAAACSRGTTVIANAAREPEISDLAAYLNRCGARIYGAGEGCIIIDGVKELYGCEHTVMPDRIVAATYMAAAAVTGGNVTLRDVDNTHILPMLAPFEQSGCSVRQLGRALNIMAPRRLSAVRHIRTMPYPGFPTDAQPVVMAMAAVGRGTSIFVETIFENRFKHAEGLERLGAKIKVEGKVAIVEGVEHLTGAPVMSHDLRGGAALVVAGLCAQGRTQVDGVEYIRRGYEDLAGNLADLGARIREVEEAP